MNNFQTILVAIFLAFFVFGVLVFSGLINIGGSKTGKDAITGKIVVWGTLPYNQTSDLLDHLSGSGSKFTIKYVQQDENTYQNSLTEAFAKDQGPDLFILKPDMILRNSGFIYTIPYASYSEKSFRTTYIDGSDILLNKDGVMGYPLLVDPLVLYFNKNILANEGILYPPSTWNELFTLSSKLIKKRSDGAVTQSMIALGEYDNVNHSKDILSMLLLQNKNPIVSRTDTGYILNLRDLAPDKTVPIEQVLNFFLEFSNPSKDSYTWNRAMDNSFDMFIKGNLAFYIGYASELFKIQSVNPNLSFDVAMIPQLKNTDAKTTYGQIDSVFISKKSKNLNSAFGVAALISSPDFLKDLAISASLPTADRSLLNVKPQDPYLLTFFNSAIVSKSWLDPDKDKSNSIFSELVENSLSNKLSSLDAIDKASNQLDLIVRSYNTQ
ncbi:MAG: extracellular solute-binding protein [Candidatus Nomurabacteria bacterium]